VKLWFKLLLLSTLTIWIAVFTLPDNNLHVVFCNVGQGDATLIYQGTNQLLIDGGPDDKVLDCLSRHMPFYDRRIETVILTHDNSDHSKGLSYVRDRYSVIHFEPKLRTGNEVKMGRVLYKVLYPDEKVLGAGIISADNELGIVGKVSYGDFDVLMTADVSSAKYQPEKSIEVLKVPHHGSQTGLTESWIDKAKPVLAVISVGKGNRFGHPSPDIVNWLVKAGVKVLRTDINGEVEVVSDGKKWWLVK
jgi:competence protein ComEC